MPLEEIDKTKLPKHIAIIMDGNGRWAQQRGKLRTYGHKNAISAVKAAIEACRDASIQYLTLFAFSSENWDRPEREVNTLMKLLITNLRKELNSLIENQLQVKTIGDLQKLPHKLIQELSEVKDKTKHFNKGTLTIALSYGSKQEIVQAVQSIAAKVKENTVQIEDINEQTINDALYTHELPDVDLLIRTSGEQRISNFMLWQIAYAELYFTETLWPDFTKEELYKAIVHYQNKERRFGKTSAQLKL